MEIGQRHGRAVGAALALALSSLLYLACGGSGAAPSASRPAASATTGRPVSTEDYAATAADFRSLKTMTKVRGFFVDNRRGHLAAAVAIAKANTGGVYPVGTILQLVPQEAMVKRRAGWNAATNDWEFFFLDVTKAGATILTRGADEVVNRFGGNCASCHAAAEPKFDFVCEHAHGCEELPISDKVIATIQEADPRSH